jgi:hypothetical protein
LRELRRNSRPICARTSPSVAGVIGMTLGDSFTDH